MQYFKLIYNQKAPQQLGRFLIKNGFSHRNITNARNNGGLMLVNHKRRYTKWMLHQGDEVIFILGQEKDNKWLKPNEGELNILKEEHDYLIINKPAGLLSIPSRYEDSDSVVNRLLFHFKDKKIKPHVVTRLDKYTSGLVLVGKNPVAQARFSKLDKESMMKKYHAIVHGNFSDNELSGLIDLPIGKKDNTIKRYILANGQKAQTEYRVLEQVPGASLVELRLLTGRTHQIRVHMNALGHPLFGDQLYGVKDNFDRQALNCFYLGYLDPFSNEKIEVKISDPDDMKKLWNKLSGNN